MFDKKYSGNNLDLISYPLGGIGAGMICLDGRGSLSHVSIMHKPDVMNEPICFGALSIKGIGARVLEGQIPIRKIMISPKVSTTGASNGLGQTCYGLPRYKQAEFQSKFPFADISLEDCDLPVGVKITGFSPFVVGDSDNSSLPMASLEYTFTNNSKHGYTSRCSSLCHHNNLPNTKVCHLFVLKLSVI